MRAWLKVLNDRHPQVTWVPVSHQPVTTEERVRANFVTLEQLARSA
jgi:hypothetical protein